MYSVYHFTNAVKSPLVKYVLLKATFDIDPHLGVDS